MASDGAPNSQLRSLNDVLCEHLIVVLDACDWNCTRAAAVLGINRKTVYRMIERFGLTKPDHPSEDDDK